MNKQRRDRMNNLLETMRGAQDELQANMDEEQEAIAHKS